MRILLTLLLGFCVNSVLAQWKNNPATNNAISVMANTQYAPSLVDDGSGGAIIAWNDDRGGISDIYMQRIDAGGNVLWTTNGIAVCNAPGYQFFPQLVSDGAGGAVLIWNDLRNDPGNYSNYDVYMQRVDGQGNALWAANGIVICNAPNNQTNPNLITFGSSYLVTWTDNRNSTSNSDIYGQLVDANGNALWTTNGIVINSSAGNQSVSKAVFDGTNVIVAWGDERSGNYDIYAQQLDVNGNRLWTSTGVAICTTNGWQADANLVSDGLGGAIITWEDGRTGTPTDVYAQRVSSSSSNAKRQKYINAFILENHLFM